MILKSNTLCWHRVETVNLGRLSIDLWFSEQRTTQQQISRTCWNGLDELDAIFGNCDTLLEAK